MQVTSPVTVNTLNVYNATFLSASSIPVGQYVNPKYQPPFVETAPQWSNAITYGVGSYVYWVDYVYESLISGNVGNNPLVDQNTGGTRWLKIAPINRLAPFDLDSNTGALVPAPTNTATFTLQTKDKVIGNNYPTLYDAIGFLNLQNVLNVQVEIVVDSVVVYSNTLSPLVRSNPDTWFSYFFADYSPSTSTAIFNLPKYGASTINLTFTKLDQLSNMQIGSIIHGETTYLGDVADGAITDSLNFSVIDVDDFGNTTLRKRKSTNTMEVELMSDQGNATTLNLLRTNLNATPAMWTGLDDPNDAYFGNLIMLGIYERFTTRLQRPKVFTSLKVREL